MFKLRGCGIGTWQPSCNAIKIGLATIVATEQAVMYIFVY